MLNILEFLSMPPIGMC